MKRLLVQVFSADQYPVPQDPTLCKSEYLRHCRSAAPKVFCSPNCSSCGLSPSVTEPMTTRCPAYFFGFLISGQCFTSRKVPHFLLVPGKALHKRSIAILAGMCTAHIGIDRVTAYRQTRLSHDVLCFPSRMMIPFITSSMISVPLTLY